MKMDRKNEKQLFQQENGSKNSENGLKKLSSFFCFWRTPPAPQGHLASLRFLTASALEARRKEERELRREQTEVEDARLELRSLIVVPASRRTAEQERRIRACALAISTASRMRRKRRRKKAPKS